MSEEFLYYKGKHKVKVVTQAEGYWIIEAMEQFKDTLNGEEVIVQIGEKRIVPPNAVYKNKSLNLTDQKNTCKNKLEIKSRRKVRRKK